MGHKNCDQHFRKLRNTDGLQYVPQTSDNIPSPMLLDLNSRITEIFRPALKTIMNSYSLRKSFPRAVVLGGAQYFGLEIDDFVIARRSHQLKYVVTDCIIDV